MQMMKFIGKPYAGKPHVRFDEGAGEAWAFPALLYRKTLRTLWLNFFLPPYHSKAGTKGQKKIQSDNFADELLRLIKLPVTKGVTIDMAEMC